MTIGAYDLAPPHELHAAEGSARPTFSLARANSALHGSNMGGTAVHTFTADALMGA